METVASRQTLQSEGRLCINFVGFINIIRFGNEIFMFGGVQTVNGEDIITNQFLMFDATTREFSEPTLTSSEDIPPPRMGASLVYVPTCGHQQLNPCLYLFGGLGSNQTLLNDLYCFNTSSKVWSKITPNGAPPEARESHTANFWADKKKICIYGGFAKHETDNTSNHKDLVFYDIGMFLTFLF
jgi:hypothetical protein